MVVAEHVVDALTLASVAEAFEDTRDQLDRDQGAFLCGVGDALVELAALKSVLLLVTFFLLAHEPLDELSAFHQLGLKEV